MSQATVEAGIVGTVRLHADFDSANCVVYDRKPLAKGLARLCFISYSTHTREAITLKLERRTWVYNVDVLVPWRGDLAELDSRIGTETQKVIDTLAKYPRLNGTADIQTTEMVVSTSPDLLAERKGVYRGRRHTLNVLEIFDPGKVE